MHLFGSANANLSADQRDFERKGYREETAAPANVSDDSAEEFNEEENHELAMSFTDFAKRLKHIERAEYTIYEGGEDTKKDPKKKQEEMEQEFERLENSINRANAG